VSSNFQQFIVPAGNEKPQTAPVQSGALHGCDKPINPLTICYYGLANRLQMAIAASLLPPHSSAGMPGKEQRACLLRTDTMKSGS
jgi:hypothetical protein